MKNNLNKKQESPYGVIAAIVGGIIGTLAIPVILYLFLKYF